MQSQHKILSHSLQIEDVYSLQKRFIQTQKKSLNSVLSHVAFYSCKLTISNSVMIRVNQIILTA